MDHTWIWRADHGHNVGWDQNLSRNGLIVNGDRVTIYGLFVEHHQQYQVLWNGNAGRTYFYQSEIPYDPPTQSAYSSAAQTAGAERTAGWASYKIAPGVTTHEPGDSASTASSPIPTFSLHAPSKYRNSPEFVSTTWITVCLEHKGGVRNVINNAGGSTSCGSPRIEPRVTSFPD